GNSGSLGTEAFFKTTGTAPATTAAKGLGNTDVQLAPVYFIDNTSGNFLGYDATNGFTAINAYTTIASAAADGTSGVVRLTASEAMSAASDRTVAALGFYASGSSLNLTNTSGSDRTITI